MAVRLRCCVMRSRLLQAVRSCSETLPAPCHRKEERRRADEALLKAAAESETREKGGVEDLGREKAALRKAHEKQVRGSGLAMRHMAASTRA